MKEMRRHRQWLALHVSPSEAYDSHFPHPLPGQQLTVSPTPLSGIRSSLSDVRPSAVRSSASSEEQLGLCAPGHAPAAPMAEIQTSLRSPGGESSHSQDFFRDPRPGAMSGHPPRGSVWEGLQAREGVLYCSTLCEQQEGSIRAKLLSYMMKISLDIRVS
jgi:hypothetical protein